MTINICSDMPLGAGFACAPGPQEQATLLIKDVHEKFRVDWNHRREEFRQAAERGKLRFTFLNEIKFVEINCRQHQYNCVLECNDRISYYLFIELKK